MRKVGLFLIAMLLVTTLAFAQEKKESVSLTMVFVALLRAASWR